MYFGMKFNATMNSISPAIGDNDCGVPYAVTLTPSPPPITPPPPCPTEFPPTPASHKLQPWQIVMIALNACLLGVLLMVVLAGGFYFCARRVPYERIQ